MTHHFAHSQMIELGTYGNRKNYMAVCMKKIRRDDDWCKLLSDSVNGLHVRLLLLATFKDG